MGCFFVGCTLSLARWDAGCFARGQRHRAAQWRYPRAPCEPAAHREATRPASVHLVTVVGRATRAAARRRARAARRGEANSAAHRVHSAPARAVRADPRNPPARLRPARVRLAQGLWQAAANAAAKSNSLAAGDTELQRRNWRVIAEARQRMGDNAGARAARAHAEK